MKMMNLATRSGMSLRLRFDEPLSVEVEGRYFTISLGSTVLGVSVSEDRLLFLLEQAPSMQQGNIVAYDFGGNFLWNISDLLGFQESFISGTVMNSAEIRPLLSRFSQIPVIPDHAYYFATPQSGGACVIDLTEGKLIFRK